MSKLAVIIFVALICAAMIACGPEAAEPTDAALAALSTQSPAETPIPVATANISPTPTPAPPTTGPTVAPTPAPTPTVTTTSEPEPFSPDKEALIALYHATGGPNWKNNQNWLSDEPIRKWYGVRFNRGVVAELWLPDNGLTGEIPPELENFERLIGLDLSGNQLTGDIPPELWNLTSLVKLDLSGNRLTGEIPAELGNIKSMRKLLLAGNHLTGELPEELGRLIFLEILELAGNRLTGCIPDRFHEVTVRWKGSEGSFDFGGLQPCPVAAAPTRIPVRRSTPTPTPAPEASPAPTAGPTRTPTPATAAAPTPMPAVAATRVPAAAREGSAAALPWVLDGLSEHERAALKGLQHVEREHPSLAPAILSLEWVRDGIIYGGESGALSGLQSIPAENTALLRILVASPWFANGIATEEQRIGWVQVLMINSRDPSLAVRAAALTWVADGTTDWEWKQISKLQHFLEVDAALAHRVVGEHWFADGISPIEGNLMFYLERLARQNVDEANYFLDLPEWQEPLEGLLVNALIRVPNLMEAGLWEEIIRQPWYKDGLSEEEYILLVAAYEVRRNEQFSLEIIHGVATGDHIMVEDDFTLPLGGKVKLFAVSRDTSLLDEVFERNRTAVVEIEKFVGVPFPKTYAGVFYEPTEPSNYRDVFVNVGSASESVIYHEVGHSYFRQKPLPKWVSEGAAEFLAYYIVHEGDIGSHYSLRNCATIGVNKVQDLLDYRENVGPGGDILCEYTMGRKFLEGMYVHLGGDVISAWLRALYRAAENTPDPKTGSVDWMTEAEIYRIMLSNTPPGKQDEFRALYRQLHGGPTPGT